MLLDVPEQGVPQIRGIHVTPRRGQQGLPKVGEVSLGSLELPIADTS